MTCLFSSREKNNLPFHRHLCQKPSFRNWKEKGLYFLHIFYRKHFLVLCHGRGFHTLVASRMEMDMAVETSWLWNPDSKISRKMRKVWGTLNDSCGNNLWTLWGDFGMAANATCLCPGPSKAGFKFGHDTEGALLSWIMPRYVSGCDMYGFL